jgi:hypothetical protein
MPKSEPLRCSIVSSIVSQERKKMIELDERTILFEAIEIAAGYLVAIGYGDTDARAQALKHIGPLFKRGERRPLMLANRAIEQIEARNVIGEDGEVIDVAKLFSWPA